MQTEEKVQLFWKAEGIRRRSSNNETNLELMVERMGGSSESDLVHLERRKQRTASAKATFAVATPTGSTWILCYFMKS